ncbi:MAG: hypothetical protein JKY98_10365 [Gammaproteobacteria bacterium]|nr:hypothetical protein [Gammaproteobacteria bacterium]
MYRSFLILFSMLFATTGFAQAFNYTYVEGGLGYIDDRTGSDVDAYGGLIGGSYALNSDFHVFAGYSKVEFDDFDDFDVSGTELGIGYNMAISDAIDFVATASWITADVDISGIGSDSDDGLSATLGIRAWASKFWEVNTGIGIAKFSDSDNDTAVYAGADYYVTRNISIGLSGAWSDSEIGSYALSLRYNFD